MRERFHPFSYEQARLACMFFYMAPGLSYALITSRMPALKTLTGATEGEIGLILLVFGLAGLVGLLFAPRLVRVFSVKSVLIAAAAGSLINAVFVSFSMSVIAFGLAMALLGICFGLCDVTMNMQGVEVERFYKKPSMSILHAGYNLGAVAGALTGSLFATTHLPLWVNYTLPALGLGLMLYWGTPRLLDDRTEVRGTPTPAAESDGEVESKREPESHRIPLLVWVCGLLSMICYVSEGSVGEWGSLYLHQEKGAPESVAALVFAGFSVCSLVCRLTADRLRSAFGDVALSAAGATLAFVGMCAVLIASSWTVCLVGYALIGLGLGPIVPIAFSRAGAIEGVNLAKVTAYVSFLAYAGLLFAPPSFGFFAEHFGLHASLSAVPVLLAILAALALLMGRLLKSSRTH